MTSHITKDKRKHDFITSISPVHTNKKSLRRLWCEIHDKIHNVYVTVEVKEEGD